MLIRFAYDVRDSQLSGGPSWMDSDRWDISAKPEQEIPNGPAGTDVMRKMLRSLLAERFHRKVHPEKKEMPIYAVVAGKGPSKLKPAAPESEPMIRMGRATLNASKVTMAELARALSDSAGRAVIDEFGLTGAYDVNLEFAPEAGAVLKPGGAPFEGAVDSDRPTLFTAVQEQLGLKLEARKAPVDVYVIDSAEKATEN